MSPDAPLRVADTLASGWIGQGPQVDEFERRFAAAVKAPSPVLALNSCTSAIDLALHLCDVGPGDSVISTPMTCAATNAAIVRRGATLIWADVLPDTGLIDPMSFFRSADTKAIVAVDYAGRACDYQSLRIQGLPIIQDAAHRFAALDGSRGDFVCWSHQAIKFLTTGDGGTLLCPPEHSERAKKLRWFGLDRSRPTCGQDIPEVGYKYAMNDIAATIGICNLEEAAAAVELQTARAARYCAAFHGLSGVTVPPFDSDCSYWLFVLLVSDREDFIAFAKSRGITAGEVHRRNDLLSGMQPASGGNLPGLEWFSIRQVAIPVGWWLDTEDEEKIIRCVQDWSTRVSLRMPAYA
jgi:dTDP-4-amino-4,6-dideoxygalactose transaminase